MAILRTLRAGLLWLIFLGWLAHLWSCLDAALFKPGLV